MDISSSLRPLFKFVDDLSSEIDELPVSEADECFWREEVLLAITGDDAKRLNSAMRHKLANMNGNCCCLF